jgi:hypothetical protein
MGGGPLRCPVARPGRGVAQKTFWPCDLEGEQRGGRVLDPRGQESESPVCRLSEMRAPPLPERDELGVKCCLCVSAIETAE